MGAGVRHVEVAAMDVGRPGIVTGAALDAAATGGGWVITRVILVVVGTL